MSDDEHAQAETPTKDTEAKEKANVKEETNKEAVPVI